MRRHWWDLIVSQGVAATGSMSLTGPFVVPRGVAGCDFTGGVSYVVSLGRRLRRFFVVQRSLSSCLGTSPGLTALTGSFAVSDIGWLEFRPFIVPRDVAVHDGFDGISFVV